MSIRELRKKSKHSLEKLTSKLNENNYSDDRYWQPTVDTAGNGQAIIRFLPETDGEDTPYVKLFSHAFHHNKSRWIIEKCPTTNGDQCPICADISPMWNDESTKPVAMERKRRTAFITNILVINDPANAENNGKVFMYKIGVKIFEKIQEAIAPRFDGDVAFVPFDFWEGANFDLRIVKKDGYRNYDNSRFAPISELLGGDDNKLDVIWKQQHKLLPELETKTFEELEKLYNSVVYNKQAVRKTAEDVVVDTQLEELPKFEPAPVVTEDTASDDLEGYLNSLDS